MNLPIDPNGKAVQALKPITTTAVNVTLSGSSQALAIPTGAKLLRVAATGNCYVEFGDNTVVADANSALFPAGVEIFVLAPSWTHMAVIREGAATGTASISEMQ